MRNVTIENINAVRYAAVKPLARSKQPSRRQDIGRYTFDLYDQPYPFIFFVLSDLLPTYLSVYCVTCDMQNERR